MVNEADISTVPRQEFDLYEVGAFHPLVPLQGLPGAITPLAENYR
jgi:hypothetical protein